MPQFFLTTPIYYVNARPHLGHTYTTIVADAITRYKRMRGYEVIFLTGTDEHGQKVERSARATGLAPKAFADRISAEYRRLWDELDLGHNRFVRTTEDRHEHAVRNLLLKARDNGYLYKGHYEGQYCTFDELYVDDPTPGAPCPDCGRPTERLREENYFFKLSAFQDRLLALYESQPDFVRPESRRNEVIAFVRGGLRDLSISRTSLKWGIPFPEDEKHVIYVWYDALTSYMTGVGYGDDEIQWETYWPADLHLIGKEILRFHAVYWPAFLMAADEPLPKSVFAHGWWLFEDEKMSKSRGNIQLPQPIARVLGVDALRYFLLREMVFGQDCNFSRSALIDRYNSDLANGLGNLASRTLKMIEAYCQGKIPPAHAHERLADHAEEYPDLSRRTREAVQAQYDSYAFSQALETIWALVAGVDKYLTVNQPWALSGDPSQRSLLERVLYNAADALRFVAVLAHPALPHATQRIWQQLGQPGDLADQKMDDLQAGQLEPGATIGEPEAIFPRVRKDEAVERIEAMEHDLRSEPAAKPAAAQPAPPEKGNMITIDDFAKIDMRVGEIKSAERVAGADKLLKLMVDIGDEVRQIVAGIATVYKPEELVGRKVVVVTNLQPRKLRGVESNGMVVAASVGPEGRPVLATFTEDVAVGSRLK